VEVTRRETPGSDGARTVGDRVSIGRPPRPHTPNPRRRRGTSSDATLRQRGEEVRPGEARSSRSRRWRRAWCPRSAMRMRCVSRCWN